MNNDKERKKNIISFSLYGSSPRFTHGAIINLELASILYPDWTCRFYVDQSVPPHILENLRQNGGEIIHIPPEKTRTLGGRFYRFLVVDDPEVNLFMIRDTDSRLNVREKAAVDEWIDSGFQIHLIKDHPWHAYNDNEKFPILGGLWGGKSGSIPGFREEMMKWPSQFAYEDDMKFLKSVFHLMNQSSILMHDSYTCEMFPFARSFPTRRFVTRQYIEFCGQIFDESGNPLESHMHSIRHTSAPQSCRRHPSWNWG